MTDNKKSTGFWALIVKLGSKFLPAIVKSAKLIKVGLALATFAAYSALFTWKFALLVMAAIGWHESGHVWAMKRCEIKTSGFYFLPFLGGVAVAKGEYKSYSTWSFIALMGPIWGLALSLACLCAYLCLGLPWLAAAASWMAAINLFNLLPVNPLDGGQVMRTITFSIHEKAGLYFLGGSMLLGIVLMMKLHILIFAILLGFAAMELWREWIKNKDYREVKELYEQHQDQMSGDLRCQMAGYLASNQGPQPLSKMAMTWTVLGYVGTVAALFGIVLGLSHIAGADLAANFFKD
jgi:Zn-dependent protease